MSTIGTIMSGATVGTLVFVLGQYFLKLVLEPAVELRKLIANVATALTDYANLYGAAGASVNILTPLVPPSADASKHVRRLAAQLQAQAYTVVGYRLAEWCFRLPPRDDVIKATSELIGISNSFPGSSAITPGQGHGNTETRHKIEQLLRIYNATGQSVAANRQLNSDIKDKARHVLAQRRTGGRNNGI